MGKLYQFNHIDNILEEPAIPDKVEPFVSKREGSLDLPASPTHSKDESKNHDMQDTKPATTVKQPTIEGKKKPIPLRRHQEPRKGKLGLLLCLY